MIKITFTYFLLIFTFISPHFLLAHGSNHSFSVKKNWQQTIRGTVLDSEGNPLPGVTVINKKTKKATTTDFDGNFIIEGSVGDELYFSYLGFQQKSIIVSRIEESLNITLGIGDDSLDEVEIISVNKSETEENQLIPCWKAKRLISKTMFDSRFETYELDSLVNWQKNIKKQIKSVAIIIEKEKLYPISNSEYQLDVSNSLKKVYNLCENQNFEDQPVIGIGTGFIISKDIMATADHVFETDIDNYVVVFGCQLINSSGAVNSRIKAANIFYPKKIVNRFDNLDVVTFKVDRPFERPQLIWENSQSLEEKSEIYMIGNPSGLPTKIALNADIVDNSSIQFFYTSLDGFQGNSGSPIFNLCTNKVIGVLVSGEIDYEYNGNCYETTLCKFPYCKGEKVIRIENIMERMNN